MSISYKTRRIKDPRKLDEPGKYYPVPAPKGKVTSQEVAREIAVRTSLSFTDVIASLDALMNVIPFFLSQGYAVDLGDFGIFRIFFSGKGSDKESEVTAASIKSLRLVFRPGMELKNKIMNFEIVKKGQ